MRFIYTLFLCLIFISSKAQYKTEIVGEVTGIPTSKLYLVNAHHWRNRIDSVEYKEGRFKFIIENNKEPILASIVYFNKENKMLRLAFMNDELSASGKKNATTAFMIDDGVIKIKGDWTGVTFIFDLKPLKIEAGAQNKFYQKNYDKNIGHIDNENPRKRLENFDKIKQLVKEASYSFYLLGQIRDNKSSYRNTELAQLLGMFDERVKASASAKELHNYLINKKEVYEVTTSLNLPDSNDVLKEGINKNKKLNMLIFWASWCVPCRKEIPLLKILKNEITSSHFYMASISVDKKRSDWLKALREEKMDWDQFIVNEKDLNSVITEYDCSAIPTVIFTDQSGKILKRHEGFSKNALEDYEVFIKNSLN